MLQAIYTLIAISGWVAIPCGLLLLSIVIFSRRNPQQYTGDYFANAFGDVPFVDSGLRLRADSGGGSDLRAQSLGSNDVSHKHRETGI